MTENEFGAQYQPCRDVTVLGFFTEITMQILYGDVAIT